MIEKGRHLGIDRNQRFCPFCPNKIEDEKHFLTRCPQYRHLREILFDHVKTVIPQVHNRCDDRKFLNLMSSFQYPVSQFSFKSNGIKRVLIGKTQIVRLKGKPYVVRSAPRFSVYCYISIVLYIFIEFQSSFYVFKYCKV